MHIQGCVPLFLCFVFCVYISVAWLCNVVGLICIPSNASIFNDGNVARQ